MAVSESITKMCRVCGYVRPHIDFYTRSGTKDGLRSSCKMCCNAESRAYALRNPENTKATSTKWREENKDASRLAVAKWRSKNREKANASSARWSRNNKDKHRINEQNRRAKQRANGGTLSKNVGARLYALQRGKCACCKTDISSGYHLDHIMPLALGGPNTDDNIQLLCKRCNQQKNAIHPVEFMRKRGFLL